MKSIKVIVLLLIASMLWNCDTTVQLAGHFHANAKQESAETVTVRIKMPGQLMQKAIYLAKFDPVGRIMPAPEDGVKNPGREELRVGTLYFSDNAEEELKAFSGQQGDNEVYSWDPSCDFLEVEIKVNPDVLRKVNFSSAEVIVPQGIEKIYTGGEQRMETEDPCYGPFASVQNLDNGFEGPLYGVVMWHPGHKPHKNIEPGMDGIPIER